jgi:hypothetical protein
MQTQLVKYDAACRAIADAKSIDEVKEITNRAEAARAYARQAKNRQLEIDAVEIRVRSERRLGEIIIEMKTQNLGVIQGVRSHTERGSETPIRLADLGVDSDISGMSQRLARLPNDRFEHEVTSWRSKAETASRLEMPLQAYRRPSIKADRQRQAERWKRPTIDASDRFAKFKSIDGRRIADWRAGELDRLIDVLERLLDCGKALRSNMPVANPDPLATMEMIFDRDSLEPMLEEIWARRIAFCNAGVSAVPASIERRTKTCESCSKSFVMDSRGGRAGRFCSRKCAWEAQRKLKA